MARRQRLWKLLETTYLRAPPGPPCGRQSEYRDLGLGRKKRGGKAVLLVVCRRLRVVAAFCLLRGRIDDE